MKKLSKPQEAIYYVSRRHENSITNISGDIFFNFLIKIEDAERAIHFFLDNCKIMHTRIVLEDGVPMQIIEQKNTKERIPVIEFGTKKEYFDWMEDEKTKPINIMRQLYRFHIVKVDNQVGIFVVFHHLIGDASSLVFIGRCLGRYLNGEKDIPIYSYDEYIDAEIEYEKSARYIKDKEYWLNECQKYNINYYYSSEFKSTSSHRELLTISKELTNKIKEFGEKHNISEYGVLLSALAVYYSKVIQKGQFFIGTPVLNRYTVRETNMMGNFVNQVPIGFDINADKGFLSVCKETMDKIFTAFRHQKYPYSQLLKDISDLGDNPEKLFDVNFSFLNIQTLEYSKAEWFHCNNQSESLQLQIDDKENKGFYYVGYNYQVEKFTKQDINNLHQRLMTLLCDAIENPEKPLYELEYLTAEEKKKVLVDFNDTVVEYSKKHSVYELFEEQAERTPNKQAVIFKNISLTYAELKEQVEKYASRLAHIGINAKDIVAVHLDRSYEIIIFQLAILKIGAIFLPVDKRYPVGRIQQMCVNCDVSLLISDELDRTSINANVILLNDFKLISPTSSSVTITNLDDCYIIYTSGSTGVPKGCLLTGKGLLNFCLNNNTLETLNKIENPVFACVNSASFDYFIAETLLPLTNGFTTVVLNDDESTMQELFLEVVTTNNINVVMTTPTRLKIYYGNKNNCDILKNIACICTSGEPLTPDLLETMYNKSPDAMVYNPIGPSECSVWDMGGRLEKAEGLDIHIGKPIANAQIYIVDNHLNPMPIGVTGEICIAGDGVGSGYINNPELTAEKFVDNPFGGGKIYKTGDLAYWREDGNICYVGRNDFQVKVNGLRIELGEIQSALEAIDGIEHAVVVVRESNDNRQIICAFYTGVMTDARDLRNILGTKLPKYMIPHIFTCLAEMPLTTSGKLDRKALPQIDFNSISTETEYVAPETEAEKALAKALSTVLNVERVSMLDNFFNIGGDSINAIYVVSELEDMHYSLQVADIMQSDTLKDIVLAIKSTSDEDNYDQNEVVDFIPFSPIMRAYIKENKTIDKNFVHTCIISADCDEDTVRKAIDALTSHHDILRGTFTDNGIDILSSNARQAYSFQSIIIHGINKATEYLKNTTLDDKLVKVIFCKTDEANLICITVHHFLIDLVSWEILMKDFTIVVNQIMSGKEVSLSAKSASFKLWNEELRKYSKTMENKEYWDNIINQLDNAHSLNTQEDENDAEEFSFTFDKNISNKLINEVNKTYGTRINEVLVTALGLAAGKLADGSVGIMVESHGRTPLPKPVAIEHTIGWFTSCYPVIVNNSGIIADELINAKETLRRIPRNGIEYLLMSDGFHKNSDIIFNFYRNSISNKNRENKLIAFGGTSVFPGKINVSCFVSDDILSIGITVPKCKHRINISEELGLEFIAQIENIVNICTTTDTVIKTRSDFSDDTLTQNELDELQDLFDWGNDDEEQY